MSDVCKHCVTAPCHQAAPLVFPKVNYIALDSFISLLTSLIKARR
jgi:hypothetical protein